MPDITYSISAQVNKGALQQQFAASGITTNISTAGVMSTTLALNTTTSAVSTASLNALGLCFARNLATDTTHTVSFGRLSGDTLYETLRLKAGEAAVLRLAPGDYAAKAAVNSTRLLLTIYED